MVDVGLVFEVEVFVDVRVVLVDDVLGFSRFFFCNF
jgi:hypothetical protein